MATPAETELQMETNGDKSPDTISGGLKSKDLRDYIGRVERLDVEKQGIADDIKAVYQEAKSAGFNPQIMKKIVAMRKKDAHELEELEILMDLYKRAIGMD